MRLVGWAVHDVLVHFPGIADQLLTRQNFPPSSVPLVEYGVGVLSEAGFDERRAATAFNVLSSYVVTRSHFEAYQRLVSEQQEATVNERAREGWERLAEAIDESPHAASYVRCLGELDDPVLIFERGLDLVLRGLRDELEG
ncbi:MAG: TetR/AcrR family transcriptional regulator C-terminal domain-containing protein [Acidimicrobiia bacterium]|nr:TetR/AcrR family transcriptional regulator C-terminal domain-containing protein [Acidimicrobiia bacterium]